MPWEQIQAMSDRAGFHWWPVSYPFTRPEFRHLWRELLVGLPPIGRGNRWVNVARPAGAILDIDGILMNFTIPGCWVGGYREAYALMFDGIASFLQISDSAAQRCFDLTDAISFDAWIFPTETNDVVIAAKRDAANFAWELRISADPNNFLEARINAVGNVATSAQSIPEYAWSHVGFRYDRKNIQVFVNGYQDGTAAFNAAINVITTNITLGCNKTAAPSYYTGKMSVARQWGRKLQSREFEELSLLPYAMFQRYSGIPVGTNYVARLSIPPLVQTDGSLGALSLDLTDTRIMAQIDSKQRSAAVERAYPRQPDMDGRSDAGPRDMHEMTSFAHGWGAKPYNVNARGLDLRKDQKQKKWP
jgi:hypothetical protein